MSQHRPTNLQQDGTRLRLLSYNVQVAIAANRPHHYLTYSWKHLLPHAQIFENMDKIADLVREFDIVGLQEVDGGSLRTGFINQTAYLADKAQFPHWFDQTNRRIGRLARHSNGLLSKFSPNQIMEHKLPGRVPGRGAMAIEYGDPSNPLLIVLLHLALSKRARAIQLGYVNQLIRDYEHVVVMGDMNCTPGSGELSTLLNGTTLRPPVDGLHTFPSWKPRVKLDHILVSSSLDIRRIKVLNCQISDHLPIAVDILLPAGLQLQAA